MSFHIYADIQLVIDYSDSYKAQDQNNCFYICIKEMSYYSLYTYACDSE